MENYTKAVASDTKVAKTTCADLAFLIDAREHDYDGAISLVNHLPEVFARVREWPLSYDVSLLLLIALRMGRRRNQVRGRDYVGVANLHSHKRH